MNRYIYLDRPVETRDGSVLAPTFLEKRPVQLEPFSLTEAPETHKGDMRKAGRALEMFSLTEAPEIHKGDMRKAGRALEMFSLTEAPEM